MDDGAGRSLYRFKCFSDDMIAALRQDLDRDIFGDHIVVDESP